MAQIKTELTTTIGLTIERAKAERVLELLGDNEDIKQALGLARYQGKDRKRQGGAKGQRVITVWREPMISDEPVGDRELMPCLDNQ